MRTSDEGRTAHDARGGIWRTSARRAGDALGAAGATTRAAAGAAMRAAERAAAPVTRRLGERAPALARRAAPPAIPVLVALAVFLATLTALSVQHSNAGNGFDLLQWERTTFANKWLYLAGEPFRNDPSSDDAIAQYFSLRNRNSLEARRLENTVEAAIEGRINAVLLDIGVEGRMPVGGSVFPPVDIELTTAPRVLVVSPRGVIVRRETQLLRPGLLMSDAEEIEQRIEQSGQLSALIVPSGGVAAYPAIVSNGRSYRDTIATAAHEWMHHYLAFYPLGFSYFASADLTTINETVAEIVGQEIADLVVERYPDPTEPPERPPAEREPLPLVPAGEEPIERSVVLRELRLEVEGLLAEGEVAEAERRMDEVREMLDEAGHYIRRLNQAYFAWYGSYAARPDSVDPLGSQLRGIRTYAGTLPNFLVAIRDVQTRADIERLFEELQPEPGVAGVSGP